VGPRCDVGFVETVGTIRSDCDGEEILTTGGDERSSVVELGVGSTCEEAK
jgi:hypothetical protein